MREVYFVILTWNSEKVIGNCMDSILVFQNMIAHIYIVDNGSSDGTLNVIAQRKNGIKHTISVIRLEKNLGTTISRNLALKEILKIAESDSYICILDSDTRVNEDAIHTLIDELEKDPQNGVVGPQMYGADGSLQVTGRNIPTLPEKLQNVLSDRNLDKEIKQLQKKGKQSYPVGYLLSACWMMKASLFERTGLLDENIFYAPEDAEFCIRVWKSGFRVIYCPEAKIFHDWQRISRKKILSKHNYEHIKGLLYMFRKHRYCFSENKIKQLFFVIEEQRKGPIT